MAVENLSLQSLSLNSTINTSFTPSITLTKETTRPRKTRNRKYVPSDDEDDDQDDDEDLSDEEFDSPKRSGITDTIKIPVPSPSSSTKSSKQHKKIQPLPSDDEDEDDDDDLDDSEDETGDDKSGLNDSKKSLYRLQGVQSTSQLGSYTEKPMIGQPQRHSAGDSKSLMPPPATSSMVSTYDSDDDRVLAQQGYNHYNGNNTFLTDGSQLQQWQYMQQYHQAQMAQFQQQQQQPLKSKSSSSQLRQQQGLSGMELMTQLEHDKAEAKRQKPKLNPSQAKIEGLLAKLPEPGAHSISFQHVQQQQQQHQQQLRQQQQHLNNTTWIPNRSPSPAGVRSSHIMVMPSQPLAPMMGYNMYGYGYPAMPASYYPSQPVPQQHMMRQPPRSASAMSMNRR